MIVRVLWGLDAVSVCRWVPTFCKWTQYEVLPKSSGNLNRGLEPVVVRPSAARCAEQYPLRISVPTAGKLRGRVELRAFL
jgi:hypothetical protein